MKYVVKSSSGGLYGPFDTAERAEMWARTCVLEVGDYVVLELWVP